MVVNGNERPRGGWLLTGLVSYLDTHSPVPLLNATGGKRIQLILIITTTLLHLSPEPSGWMLRGVLEHICSK